MKAASRDIVLSGSTPDKAALVVGPLLIGALLLFMGGSEYAGMDAVLTVASSLPVVAMWLAASVGFGWLLRVWLIGDSAHAMPLQLSLGIAAMLTIDAALGRMGLLQIGGMVGAWAVVIAGITLLVVNLWRIRSAASDNGAARAAQIIIAAPPWLIWTAAPAVAVLLLASASAPGWLWASEFGGYDALSYHLQLPKEWMVLGAIQPLEHNVYSFLPSYMEGAYYHLALLRGDAISAVYAAQLLHASMALVTAWLVWRFVATWAGGTSREAASVAAVVLIGTPWVIVAGSLAYNEMATALMLTAGLLVFQNPTLLPTKRGTVMGIFAAAACGAKLTAAGFVAAPLGVALLLAMPARQWSRAIAAGSLAGLIVLAPYLIGNAAASGNPVFPFATSAFGAGHWTEQQVQKWNEAHLAGSQLGHRMSEAWHQLMRYGIGGSPYDGEPWDAQWSLLPWLTFAGVAVLWLLRRRDECDATNEPHNTLPLLVLIMAIQLLFWIGFTHVKSRFMLPAVVPAAAVVGMSWFAISRRLEMRRGAVPIAFGVALLIWCVLPVVIFTKQAGNAPAARVGMASMLTGAGLSESEQRQLGETLPAVYINHILPDNSRVLFIGEAAPLYYLGDYAYQTTWDPGPLSRAMREHGDDVHAWLASLRQHGFTHILVNPGMLDRWEQAGWNDPLITSRRVMAFAQQHAELELSWPSGEILFRLR